MTHFFKTPLFLLLALMLPVTAAAYNFEVDGIYYNCNGDEATVTYGTIKYTGDVTIPSTITYSGTTYPVTAIDYSAFSYCSGLTSVTIPNSVTAIRNSAFRGCTGLTTIDIPNSVATIGDEAFCNCYNLTTIDIPNSVTTIGDDAFDDTAWYNSQPDGFVYAGLVAYRYKGTMQQGTTITIREGTLGIANGAFSGCTGLTTINIPNSVTSISNSALEGCSSLKGILVASDNPKYDSRNNCNAIIETATNTLIIGCNKTTIPNSVTAIGNSAFRGCTGLTTIDIPNSVATIGDEAFCNCYSLTTIDIPNSVTAIGNSAFRDCTELMSIDIPNSVKSIGEMAFGGCSSLTTVNIPNSILSISDYTFSGCSSLTNVTIPNSVTTIGNGAFSGCSQLTIIDIPSSVTLIGNSAFSGCDGLTTVNIPNSVTSIGELAFHYCRNMKSVTIGSSISHIGNGAFYYCGLDTVNYNAISCLSFDFTVFSCEFESGITTINIGDSVQIIPDYFAAGVQHLKEIIIPNSVTSIGMWAFNACNSLSNITLGSSIKTIGDLAFAGAEITSIIIPNTVTEIGDGAFLCPRLTSVTCLATTPPTCYSSTYSSSFSSNVTSQATLYVPFKSLSAYQNAITWKDFYQIIGLHQIDDFEVDGIYYHPLTDKTVKVIPKTDEEGYYFGDVVIPDSVSYQEMQFAVIGIDANAFDGCDELNSVVIGDAVETIGEEAFQGCTGLTSVTIGSGVTSIGERAFNYCNALQTVKCLGTVPPAMASSNCFSSAAYRKATLKVPRNYAEDYTATDYWYKFEHIEGYGSAGLGDVNGDGEINITDVTVIIDRLLHANADGEFYIESADLNNNGHLDIADVITLIDMLLTSGN